MMTQQLWIGAAMALAMTLISWTPNTSRAAEGGSYWVYVGTYTQPNKSKGIELFRFDASSGALSPVGNAAELANPTFLTIAPGSKFLYAICEVSNFQNQKTGGASAFALDPSTGKLTLLNQQPSGGRGPCWISLDSTAKVALVANYGEGSVASLPIGDDGKLKEPASIIQHQGSGVNPKRQAGPHAHSFNIDPTGKFALACDLGLDKVLIYRLDTATGKLTPNDPPFAAVAPGAGPRHLAFHPNGKFVYVITEMGGTITAFAWDGSRGAMSEIQAIPTLPADFKGQSTCAEVQVHPTGKFVYGSNRGHDSIAVYSVDPTTGKLTLVGFQSTLGKGPRNFRIDPTGQFLLAANQTTDNIVVFRIDPATGLPKPTGVEVKVGAPVCIKFLAVP
jgi:6-phosphogluconolactonase